MRDSSPWLPAIGLAAGWMAALLWWVGPEWPPTGSKPGLLLTPMVALLLAATPARWAPVVGGFAGSGMAGVLLWRMLLRLPWWHAGAHLLGAALCSGLAAWALCRGEGRRSGAPICLLAGLTLLTTNSVLLGVLACVLGALYLAAGLFHPRDAPATRLRLGLLPGLFALLLDGIWVSDLPLGAALLLLCALALACVPSESPALRAHPTTLAVVLGITALGWGIVAEGLPFDL